MLLWQNMSQLIQPTDLLFAIVDCGNGVVAYETENMNSIVIMCTNTLDFTKAELACTSLSPGEGHLTDPDNPQKNPSVETVVQQGTEAIAGWYGFSKSHG